MPHAEGQVTVQAPIDKVFAFLADGLNNPKWRQGVVNIELKSGQASTVGAVYAQTMSAPGGRTIPGDFQLTTVEPNRLIEFHVIAGPARPVGRFEFSEGGGITTVNFSLDWHPKGLKEKLMSPMVAAQMPKEIAMLENLKRVLETA